MNTLELKNKLLDLNRGRIRSYDTLDGSRLELRTMTGHHIVVVQGPLCGSGIDDGRMEIYCHTCDLPLAISRWNGRADYYSDWVDEELARSHL